MKLRILAGVYILNNQDVFLMKRAENRKFYPGVWGAVGGHLEPNEINNPKEACLRETLEESGLREEDFEELKLRYITIRRCKNEIRILYSYIGHSKTRVFENKTDEGTLHWICQKDLFHREMSFVTRKTLEHYFDSGHKNEDVYVGTVCVSKNTSIINWNSVDDWDGM